MNEYQGEAELKAGEDTYTLVVNWKVLKALEAEAKMGFPAIIDELRTAPTITRIAQVLWHSLKIKYPELTLDDAGNIVFGAGMAPSFVAWFEAFNNAWHFEVEQPTDPLPAPALRSIGIG